MSHIRHYRVLPWATGPLTSPKGIAEVPDWQVAKRANPVYLLFSVSLPSTITAKAIKMIQKRNTSIHWVLLSLLIVILALKLFFSDSRALRCQYLVLE